MSHEGSLSKIYKELLQLNNKKQTIQLKTGQRNEKDIFPKKTTKWSKYIKRCQNHSEKTLMPVRTAIIQKTSNNKC